MSEDSKTFDLAWAACQAYTMTDAELGSLVIGLAQSGQKHLETMADDRLDPSDRTYLVPYFSHILPEISARLFARDGIRLSHRRPGHLVDLSDSSLRASFIEIFQSVAFRRMIDAVDSTAGGRNHIRDIDMCMAPAINGNVAVIALDRVCPSTPETADMLSMLVQMGANIRGIHCPDGRWTPDLAREMLKEIGRTDADRIVGKAGRRERLSDLDLPDSDDADLDLCSR